MASRRRLLRISVVALCVAACSNITDAASQPASPPSGAVFDDFDGPTGAPPSSKYWTYDLGHPGAAHEELQTYIESTDNIRLDGLGHLVIQALQTPTGYTSGRLVTRGKVNMLYGTIEARIKFPTGQGIWPAFWMLGSNMETVSWPQCGEIDIMELVNSGTTYYVTLHGPQGRSDYLGGSGVGAEGAIADLTTDFHTYWVTWRPDSISIGVDGTTLEQFTPTSLPPGAQWVFNDNPMYALLNVAVGGDWAGPPDESTRFPATMLVDWFRYTP
ncbi:MULTISPECIES: glycoside hydrolase family 16 protein [unclassified Mycobacterium]|uniref:glycoside hydrolase family 16 protein n=1 Tax=unclassified Mycobacterium TaxID=2642494 RepID=UPI0029C86197|nr:MULTISPECIES: glycoside hydrolase family 16 protein [unclassified Mycobacterium]